MPKIYTIMEKFKNFCRFHGWKTSESEDWIEVSKKYHNFLLARAIPLSSFQKIVSNQKCVVREGLSYRVVEASYTAWLFSEPISEAFVKTISEDSTLSGKVALYDLSPLSEEKKVCIKMNNTDSPVFEEFERFLRDELKVTFRPFSSVTRFKSVQDKSIEEIA